MNHCFSYLNHCLVLSFNNPILLGVVGNCKLPLDSCLSAKIIETTRSIFSTIAWPQDLDPLSRQVLNLSLVCSESAKYFSRVLGFQKVNPSLPRIIINEEYVTPKSS